MRLMRHHVLPIILTMVAFMLAGCEKKPVVSPVLAEKGSIAASAMPATVVLPNLTATVTQEDPAAINISTIKKIRGVFQFPAFLGLAPGAHSMNFSASLSQAAGCRMNLAAGAFSASNRFASNWQKPENMPPCRYSATTI